MYVYIFSIFVKRKKCVHKNAKKKEKENIKNKTMKYFMRTKYSYLQKNIFHSDRTLYADKIVLFFINFFFFLIK